MFNSYLQRIRAVNFCEAAVCGVVIKLCGICITDCITETFYNTGHTTYISHKRPKHPPSLSVLNLA